MMHRNSESNRDLYRTSDVRTPGPENKTYFFLCEGQNTERWYFKGLKEHKAELGISDHIGIYVCPHGSNKNSDGRNLFEYSKKLKKPGSSIRFNGDTDVMVIVFDGDKYEKEKPGYDRLIDDIEKEDMAAISNPNFELFLILHYENACEKYIDGHHNEIFPDETGVAYDYFVRKIRDCEGLDSKKDEKGVGDLARRVRVEIDAESRDDRINQNIRDIEGRVSCNVGKIIGAIIEEGKNIKPIYYR